MAGPADHVTPLKRESSATGGDDADAQPWPELLDPFEDGIDVQGVYFQPPSGSVRDSAVYVGRDGSSNMLFKDGVAAGGNEITLANLAPYFGNDVSSVQDDANSDTTAPTYQQKLSITTSSLPSGTYIVLWSFSIASSKGGKQVASRVQLDDTTVLSENTVAPNVDGGFTSICGFQVVALSGVHTIDVDWRRVDSNIVASIRSVRLIVFRLW